MLVFVPPVPQILEGTVDQSDGMGISPELQKQGYALLSPFRALI